MTLSSNSLPPLLSIARSVSACAFVGGGGEGRRRGGGGDGEEEESLSGLAEGPHSLDQVDSTPSMPHSPPLSSFSPSKGGAAPRKAVRTKERSSLSPLPRIQCVCARQGGSGNKPMGTWDYAAGRKRQQQGRKGKSVRAWSHGGRKGGRGGLLSLSNLLPRHELHSPSLPLLLSLLCTVSLAEVGTCRPQKDACLPFWAVGRECRHGRSSCTR